MTEEEVLQKLSVFKDAIVTLKTENKSLKEENEKLKEQNNTFSSNVYSKLTEIEETLNA